MQIPMACSRNLTVAMHGRRGCGAGVMAKLALVVLLMATLPSPGVLAQWHPSSGRSRTMPARRRVRQMIRRSMPAIRSSLPPWARTARRVSPATSRTRASRSKCPSSRRCSKPQAVSTRSSGRTIPPIARTRTCQRSRRGVRPSSCSWTWASHALAGRSHPVLTSPSRRKPRTDLARCRIRTTHKSPGL